MNLDSPLVIWFGRLMTIAGIFGWIQIPLFFSGIDLFSLPHHGTLGLGAIIGAVCGGIGGAFIIKSNAYRKMKKQKAEENK